MAAPCKEIVEDPGNAYKYGARGNLLVVIANGTAVLGLDDIGHRDDHIATLQAGPAWPLAA